MFGWLKQTLENRRYNKNLEKMGLIDKNEVRLTAVGWQPDGSYIPDEGNERENLLGEYDTPSKNKEYYKVIRKK